MPWKQVKDPILRLPTRQELRIIVVSLAVCVIVIVYFVLRS